MPVPPLRRVLAFILLASVDIECQCSSRNSTKLLQPCFESACTYDETFATLRAQASVCNRPHDSLSNSIRITAWVSGIAPIIVTAMRFASRHLGGNNFWWDDWVHLASVILVIPMTVFLLLNVEAGIGHHIWDLTYARVVAVGRWTYITTIFWGLEMILLKYSILCLYLRIFPNVWLKRFVFAFMAFTAAFTLPLIGLAAFQCTPIHAIWDLQAQKTAKCVDWIAVLRLTVVYEIIAEIVLFSLPIPIVLKLQMKTAKKIQLMVFFGMGICVIAMAIARVPFLPGVVDTDDQTYTVTPTSILGFAGSGVAHVCAAVPTVKNFTRFCSNGFKQERKFSSTYAKESTLDSSGKRSYKSLQDNKNNATASQTIRSAQQVSRGTSRDTLAHLQLSSIMDAEDGSAVMELHPVLTAAEGVLHPHGGRDREQEKNAWTERIPEQPPKADSASDEAILHNDPYR
ncbi:hypothetical protein PSPO01_03299 [Paraphaeosphaeria sporulosa]